MFLLNECKAKNSGVFVQAAAPELGPEDAYGVWRIDDTDNSFSTQPFRIRYARQDVLLSLMISFNLSLRKYEVPLSLSLGVCVCVRMCTHRCGMRNWPCLKRKQIYTWKKWRMSFSRANKLKTKKEEKKKGWDQQKRKSGIGI